MFGTGKVTWGLTGEATNARTAGMYRMSRGWRADPRTCPVVRVYV